MTERSEVGHWEGDLCAFAGIGMWADFIDGVPKPIIQNGYIPVPEGRVSASS